MVNEWTQKNTPSILVSVVVKVLPSHSTFITKYHKYLLTWTILMSVYAPPRAFYMIQFPLQQPLYFVFLNLSDHGNCHKEMYGHRGESPAKRSIILVLINVILSYLAPCGNEIHPNSLLQVNFFYFSYTHTKPWSLAAKTYPLFFWNGQKNRGYLCPLRSRINASTGEVFFREIKPSTLQLACHITCWIPLGLVPFSTSSCSKNVIQLDFGFGKTTYFFSTFNLPENKNKKSGKTMMTFFCARSHL